jgi:hypothetical protein
MLELPLVILKRLGEYELVGMRGSPANSAMR